MKTQLLTFLSLLLFTSVTLGQDFVQETDNTGFTYHCEESDETGYSWGYYIASCAWASNGTGGADETPAGEVSYDWGRSGAGHVYIFFSFDTPLDLSANPVVKVSLRSMQGTTTQTAFPTTYTVFLKDAGTPDADISNEMPVSVTGTDQDFTIDFTGQALATKDFTSVGSIVFHYGEDCGASPPAVVANASLIISELSAGSSTVAATKKGDITESLKVYPNPSNEKVIVEVEKISSGEQVTIKVTDVTGNVLRIEETTLPYVFDISGFEKGAYILNIESDNSLASKKLFKF